MKNSNDLFDITTSKEDYTEMTYDKFIDDVVSDVKSYEQNTTTNVWINDNTTIDDNPWMKQQSEEELQNGYDNKKKISPVKDELVEYQKKLFDNWNISDPNKTYGHKDLKDILDEIVKNFPIPSSGDTLTKMLEDINGKEKQKEEAIKKEIDRVRFVSLLKKLKYESGDIVNINIEDYAKYFFNVSYGSPDKTSDNTAALNNENIKQWFMKHSVEKTIRSKYSYNNGYIHNIGNGPWSTTSATLTQYNHYGDKIYKMNKKEPVILMDIFEVKNYSDMPEQAYHLPKLKAFLAWFYRTGDDKNPAGAGYIKFSSYLEYKNINKLIKGKED
jgi:hypothetical protein